MKMIICNGSKIILWNSQRPELLESEFNIFHVFHLTKLTADELLVVVKIIIRLEVLYSFKKNVKAIFAYDNIVIHLYLFFPDM